MAVPARSSYLRLRLSFHTLSPGPSVQGCQPWLSVSSGCRPWSQYWDVRAGRHSWHVNLGRQYWTSTPHEGPASQSRLWVPAVGTSSHYRLPVPSGRPVRRSQPPVVPGDPDGQLLLSVAGVNPDRHSWLPVPAVSPGPRSLLSVPPRPAVLQHEGRPPVAGPAIAKCDPAIAGVRSPRHAQHDYPHSIYSVAGSSASHTMASAFPGCRVPGSVYSTAVTPPSARGYRDRARVMRREIERRRAHPRRPGSAARHREGELWPIMGPEQSPNTQRSCNYEMSRPIRDPTTQMPLPAPQERSPESGDSRAPAVREGVVSHLGQFGALVQIDLCQADPQINRPERSLTWTGRTARI